MARWWDPYPEQRYWMEFVSHAARSEPGVEVFAPRTGYWEYELLRDVRPGDIIMHWLAGEGFVGSSVAYSRAQVEPREWRGLVQPCWVVELAEYEDLPRPFSLGDLRSIEEQLERTKALLEEAYVGFKYFPFDFSAKRPIRPRQGYFSKLPLEAFEVLALAGLDAPVLFDPVTGQQVERSTTAPAGPRYMANTRMRMGIERHSVACARAWYEERGATDVVELGKPYDLELVWNRDLRHVEVKGSKMRNIETVLLTPNEVAHARDFELTDLVVVDGIDVHEDGDNYRYAGGDLRRWSEWVPRSAISHLRSFCTPWNPWSSRNG